MREPPATGQPPADTPKWGDYALAAGLALVGGTVLTGLTLFVDTVPGHYLVLGAPATEAALIVYAAEAALVSATAWPNLVIADTSGVDNFRAALRAQGAWLVLPAPFAAGCLGR